MRHAPSQGPLGRRVGGAESGAYSERNAVVVRPARTAGCATSQRRNGRFVVRPFDGGLGERVAKPEQRLVAVRAVRDQLRDHRVVGDAHLVALVDPGVDADPGRQPEPLDPPGLRQERARILGVEPHLHGVPLRPCNSLLQSLSGGDAQLFLDDVDSRDELRHRMLDLDPAVQLEEVEVAPVEHELDRAGAPVAERAAERDRGVAHARAQLAVERRRGRLLEHLLMASLDRALALAERENGSVPVGEKLDLDVARPLDEALAVDAVVAERGLRLAPGRLDRVLELGRVADDPHPAPTSSGSRLDHEREADLVRLAGGQGRNSGFGRDPLRLELVAASAQRLRRRPDEEQPGRLDGLREVRVLGQEAVPGMDRVGSRLLRRPDVLLGEQVALDLDRLVRVARVEGAEVVRRGDGDGPDPRLAARSEDARGDLAAVGYEELLDRHRTANVIREANASVR